MKKKTKMLVLSAVALLVIAVSVVLIIISNKPKEEATFYTIDDIKNKISSDISKIQKGKYKNLICDDFSASLEDIEGVYNIEIQKNNDAVVWQETVYVPSNEENSYNEDTNQEEVSSATVILKNISETGYITIIKQDADTGASISGAYVSIRDESGNYYNELGLKCPSDESLIPVGISGTSIRVPVDHTYTVSEVTAPTGYYSVSKQAELGM